jgi:hypothetical protein
MVWPEVLPRAGNRRLEKLDSLSPWFEVYQKSIDYLVDLLPRVNHLCPSHNEAYVAKEALIKVQEAFEQIAADEAPYETEGNVRIYRFEGFGLMVAI